MKQNIKHNLQERRKYVPARAEVIHFTSSSFICQSGGTEDYIDHEDPLWIETA